MSPSLASVPTSHPVSYAPVYAGQVAVIGEMLASLDSLTNAGRHHVMTKNRGLRSGPRSAARRAAGPRPTVPASPTCSSSLQREAARPLPVVGSFTESVQRLLAVPGLFI